MTKPFPKFVEPFSPDKVRQMREMSKESGKIIRIIRRHEANKVEELVKAHCFKVDDGWKFEPDWDYTRVASEADDPTITAKIGKPIGKGHVQNICRMLGMYPLTQEAVPKGLRKHHSLSRLSIDLEEIANDIRERSDRIDTMSNRIDELHERFSKLETMIKGLKE